MSPNFKTKNVRLTFVLAFLEFMAIGAGCAIEAGNPSTKKPKGALNVIFSKTETSSGESMMIDLSSVGIASSTDEWLSSSSLPLVKSSLDLFSADGSSFETIVQTELSEGSYDQIILSLPNDRIGRYRDGSGVERDLLPESSGDTVYYFADTIEVKEAETTEIHIDLDPRRSIELDGDRHRFKPKGHLKHGKFDTNYEGIAPSDSAVACVYHFNSKRGGFSEGRDERSGGHHLMKRNRAKIEPVGVYESRGEIQWDSSSLCPLAFRRVVVSDQKFELKGIPPGDYAVRFFKTDDTYIDGTDFKVE